MLSTVDSVRVAKLYLESKGQWSGCGDNYENYIIVSKQRQLESRLKRWYSKWPYRLKDFIRG